MTKLFTGITILITKILTLFNPIALKKAKIVYNFGLSECNRVNLAEILISVIQKFILGLII